MPKLLQISIWKKTLEIVRLFVIMMITMAVVSLLLTLFSDGELSTPYHSFLGVASIPFLYYANSSRLPAISEYFYIAPYSRGQRKALIKKYFKQQYLVGCAFAVVWSVFVYCFAMVQGISLHPVKAAFGLAVQFCILYEILFLSYYRPRILFLVIEVVSLFIGGGLTAMISFTDQALSLADGIIMTALGILYAVPVIVLKCKHFEQLIDCYSRYEASRKVPRGF